MKTHEESVFAFRPQEPVDLVLTSGLLIHIHPEKLPELYRTLHAASRRYICMIEYYNPTPVEVPYRGEREKLDLRLCAYGFQYHRDRNFPVDDATWFLIEKK